MLSSLLNDYWLIAAFALALIGLIAAMNDSRKNKKRNIGNENPQKKNDGEKSKPSGRKSPLVKVIFLIGIGGLAIYGLGNIWAYSALSQSKSMAKEIKSSMPAMMPNTGQNIKNSSWNHKTITAPVETWSEEVHINGHHLSTFPAGKIKVMDPNGRILHDQPGVQVDWGNLPNGDYKFQSEEKYPVLVQVFIH